MLVHKVKNRSFCFFHNSSLPPSKNTIYKSLYDRGHDWNLHSGKLVYNDIKEYLESIFLASRQSAANRVVYYDYVDTTRYD